MGQNPGPPGGSVFWTELRSRKVQVCVSDDVYEAQLCKAQLRVANARERVVELNSRGSNSHCLGYVALGLWPWPERSAHTLLLRFLLANA